MAGPVCDLLIVGGGINGCGIARDAAGRGVSVVLAEKDDLAGATSSASTKLIHGGLRYLEYYEFRLVREALREREVLLRLAPHIVRPLRFILPASGGGRPAWMLRLGLFLYDHLGGRELLPPTRSVELAGTDYGRGLKPACHTGFEYSDCWVEDSRLVVLNAMDAAERGAVIRPRTEVVEARQAEGLWHVALRDSETGAVARQQARALVNCAGPWVGRFLAQVVGRNARSPIRLVKGSHIVVRRLFDHDRCFIFQNADGRIVFAIPYEGDFTLIGTTDVDYTGDPERPAITPEETDYLCRAVNTYLQEPIGPADIVHTYAGVRPLYDDGASEAKKATRDYVLELDAPAGSPPLLSVFGGKITTYRKLAEHAIEKLAAVMDIGGGGWTADAPLPGGDFPVDGVEHGIEALRGEYPFLDPSLAQRLFRAYGTRAAVLLGTASAPADLGRGFGAGLSEREVLYLMHSEWARTAEDVLWRRSKLGLRLRPEEVRELAHFMAEQRALERTAAA